MNCRESKVAIALHLGHDDADPADWEQARRHASTCDECRQHYKNLKKTMALVEDADVEQTYDVQESLWPEIEARLSSQSGLKRDESRRSWTPFISLTVACLLFLMVWINPPHEPNPGASQIHSGRSVGSFTRIFEQSSEREQAKLKEKKEAETSADAL